MSTYIIGRRREQTILERFYHDREAAFMALYGRRRVGKTYLVRAAFSDQKPFFEVTGRKKGSLRVQLNHFADSLKKTFGVMPANTQLVSWREAFDQLTNFIQKLPKSKRCVVFLDELPWLATRRSGLIQELDYFWNTVWSRDPRVRLVVCGSAASWMLDKLVHAKGGLHNRLTHRVLLEPFSLPQTREYLEARDVHWPESLITEAYMVTGGVPFYLNGFERATSPTEAVQRMCFQIDGLLYSEFDHLFDSLFNRPEKHQRIVRTLAKQRTGLSRHRLLELTGLHSGDSFNTPIRELEAAGFIKKFVPYGKKIREQWFRLTDEYAFFFLRWIEPVRDRMGSIPRRHWQIQSQTPAYRSWAGYAFEGICTKHSDAILAALGISGVACDFSSWRYSPSSATSERGAQIDLVIDRADQVISLCEIKFSQNPFTIDKSYAERLRQKASAFREQTKTRKHIQLVIIASMGLKQNVHSQSLNAYAITLQDLFRE